MPEPPPPPQEMPAEPTAIDIIPKEPDNGAFDLQKLPGITYEIARQLTRDGIGSKEAILALGAEGLQEYKGVGPKKAEVLIGVLST